MKNISLPPVITDGKFDRDKAADLLWRYEYGAPLPMPEKIEFEEFSRDDRFCASKAVFTTVKTTITVNGKTASFPLRVCRPAAPGRYPTVVFLNFRPWVPDKYLPAEEILDRGIAFVSIYYCDVAGDDDDFESGITRLYNIDRTQRTAPGKIMFWALAARCAADYLETCGFADMKNLAVAGHSRLGKTALVTGALDSRFRFMYSNNAGCSGDALFRGKGEKAEHIADITKNFPYWFCPAFRDFAGRDDEIPFDQHFLLALNADRNIYITSSMEDLWAAPEAQLACCAAASPVSRLYGRTGLDESEIKEAPFFTHSGSIGYHVRPGTHYIGRYDWNMFIDYLLKHKNA